MADSPEDNLPPDIAECDQTEADSEFSEGNPPPECQNNECDENDANARPEDVTPNDGSGDAQAVVDGAVNTTMERTESCSDFSAVVNEREDGASDAGPVNESQYQAPGTS